MSEQQTREQLLAKQRDYAKQRYEAHPEKHNQDKERSRNYIKERRKDPAYRQYENAQRKERRLRKTLIVRKEKSSTKAAAKRTSSAGKARIAIPPRTRSTKQATVEISSDGDSLAIANETGKLSPVQVDEYIVAEIETVPSHSHSLKNHEESSFRINFPGPVMNIVKSTTVNTFEDTPTNSRTRNDVQAINYVASLTNSTPMLPCNCTHSAALNKMATISRAMSVYDRQRFESGLLQFADDFMNSDPQDTFLMLICDKLKRVPDDLRPDLEVSILKTINDTLKRK